MLTCLVWGAGSGKERPVSKSLTEGQLSSRSYFTAALWPGNPKGAAFLIQTWKPVESLQGAEC